MTRHCSNLASAVHKTLCRRRLHSQSQFLDDRLLATLSRRIPHDIQSLLIVASFPRFDSHTSCTQFYLAGLPPLVRHCHFTPPKNCIIPYALPTFNTLLLRPDSLRSSLYLFCFRFFLSFIFVFFFTLLLILCHMMELDDRRRA
jgi:hypothetical protein